MNMFPHEHISLTWYMAVAPILFISPEQIYHRSSCNYIHDVRNTIARCDNAVLVQKDIVIRGMSEGLYLFNY